MSLIRLILDIPTFPVFCTLTYTLVVKRFFNKQTNLQSYGNLSIEHQKKKSFPTWEPYIDDKNHCGGI